MKWRFTLGSGPALRQMINDGDEDLESCKKTLAALETCYKEIKRRLGSGDLEDVSEELENVQEHIQILNKEEIDRLDNLIDLGFDGYNPCLECVNDDLKTFYDICDSYRIWVGGI